MERQETALFLPHVSSLLATVTTLSTIGMDGWSAVCWSVSRFQSITMFHAFILAAAIFLLVEMFCCDYDKDLGLKIWAVQL